MTIDLLEGAFGRLDLERQPLGDWPTPVQPLQQLGAQLGVDLWVKRDDLSSAIYGGNKVRKLELLLGAARTDGCQSLVTVGGIGSNHLVATAMHGRRVGLPLHAVVFPQPVTASVHQTAEILRRLQVDLVACGSRVAVPLAWRRARRRARAPYLIGPGGSSPLGTLGYVAAAFELKQQIERGELAEPDAIYIALGSGGSLAGLRLGCALAGIGSEVVGVRVVERVLTNATFVQLLESSTVRLLGRATGRPIKRRMTRPRVEHGYAGRRYGDPTAEALAAVERAGRLEGLPLETTYTGKALAALCGREQHSGRRVLFWNTYNSQPIELDHTPAATLPPRVQTWLAPREH